MALNRYREALSSGAPAPAPPAASPVPAESPAPEPSPAPAPAPVEISADVVGPGGEVLVDGVPHRVDAAHAGKAYEVRGTRSRRVRVDGRFVRKAKI